MITNLRRNLSISVHFARAVLKNAISRGVDPAALLRRNRISPQLMQQDNARISIERYANLQLSTMVAMEDEALGYTSRRMPIGTWTMMCHAVIGSETLGQALDRYCRFYQLFEFGRQPRFEVGSDSSAIKMISMEPQTSSANYVDETGLYYAHRFASWLVEEHIPVSAINLHFPPETDIENYRHTFLGNPVFFEQKESSLVIPNSLLEKRVVQDEKSLRHFLRHPILIMLTQQYEQNSWSSQVRRLLKQQLEDLPELSGVAEILQIHPHTLRRRLSAEGSSFKHIKSQVRRDTAIYLLSKQGLSIEEISHRSGFSEPSSFIRAFRGWTGVTPYSYRKGF